MERKRKKGLEKKKLFFFIQNARGLAHHTTTSHHLLSRGSFEKEHTPCQKIIAIFFFSLSLKKFFSFHFKNKRNTQQQTR